MNGPHSSIPRGYCLIKLNHPLLRFIEEINFIKSKSVTIKNV